MKMHNKNVYLLTLYNANNIGAYLQTYSTLRLLNELGQETSLLKLKSNGSTSRNSLKKYLKKMELFKLLFKYKSRKKYNNAQNIFHKVGIDEIKKPATFIVGSDECWNLNSKSFYHHKEYFGVGLGNERVISFCSCAN